MTTPTNPRSASGAETGRKILRVLLCFTADKPNWSAAELSTELDLTTSTAYRYIGLLRDEGFLRVSQDNTYRVTARALTLAEAYSANKADPIDIALPIMSQLRNEIGETILLAQRVGDFAFCIDRVESLQAVRLQFNKGQAMRLHSGALARLLLSYMPRTERGEYLEKVHQVVPRERHHLLSNEVLDDIAATGFVESMEEIEEHIWGCAAAIHQAGEDVLAIGTAGPLYRLNESARHRTKKLIASAAHEISELLQQGADVTT